MLFLKINWSPKEVLVMERLKLQNCSVIAMVTSMEIEQTLKNRFGNVYLLHWQQSTEVACILELLTGSPVLQKP